MTPLPISVCMISAAEAGRIGRALESVARWTAEINVVMNEEVQDGTEEIAKSFGAKVFREPWKGDIAQKNSAAAKGTQQWLLHMDADEAVSPELRNDIEAALAAPAARAAFSFPRLTWYCGRWIRHGDWYPDRQTRLWQRGRGVWGGVDPHGRLKVEGTVGKLNGDLYHYSGESINSRLRKIIYFSDEFVKQHLKEREPGWPTMLFRPAWRFLRAYFIRRGFLDGWPGYYIAAHTSFATLVRYAKLREARLNRETPR